MMAGKNQAALAVCAQTKVIFPFKNGGYDAVQGSINVRKTIRLKLIFFIYISVFCQSTVALSTF